jgi:hypothetical protein
MGTPYLLFKSGFFSADDLAGPATIPRARAAETGPKGNSLERLSKEIPAEKESK